MTNLTRHLHALAHEGRRGGEAGGSRTRPLSTAWLHYPGEGIHFLEPPAAEKPIRLNTPEAQGLLFRAVDPLPDGTIAGAHRKARCGVYVSPTGPPAYLRKNSPGHFRASGGQLSVGPVLLYAEMFIAGQTELGGVGTAFRSTYPTARPPIDLCPRKLIERYIMNIYPVPLDTAAQSVGLWSDLIDHGLGKLAETIVLAAQDRSYRRATGQPPPPADRRTLVERVRALATAPERPARFRGASSRA